jgi:hypothetical protein
MKKVALWSKKIKSRAAGQRCFSIFDTSIPFITWLRHACVRICANMGGLRCKKAAAALILMLLVAARSINSILPLNLGGRLHTRMMEKKGFWMCVRGGWREGDVAAANLWSVKSQRSSH